MIHQPSRSAWKSARRVLFGFSVLASPVLGKACATTDPSGGLNDVDVGLPSRTQAADLGRITQVVRDSGGNVFVKLTAEPTPTALEVLGIAGLAPPKTVPARNHLVTFDSLRIATVWGWLPPNGLSRLAALRFVIRVEPSGGDGIGF